MAANSEVSDADVAAPSLPPPLGVGTRAAYGLGSLAFGISQTVLSGSVLQIYFIR